MTIPPLTLGEQHATPDLVLGQHFYFSPHSRLQTQRNQRKPIAQLLVYALALSRRLGLRLYAFTCAWFGEHYSFEFYSLHVVHKRRRQRISRRHTQQAQ